VFTTPGAAICLPGAAASINVVMFIPAIVGYTSQTYV
jgi:hypothetical protein